LRLQFFSFPLYLDQYLILATNRICTLREELEKVPSGYRVVATASNGEHCIILEKGVPTEKHQYRLLEGNYTDKLQQQVKEAVLNGYLPVPGAVMYTTQGWLFVPVPVVVLERNPDHESKEYRIKRFHLGLAEATQEAAKTEGLVKLDQSQFAEAVACAENDGYQLLTRVAGLAIFGREKK
jgi:hypothetical protein